MKSRKFLSVLFCFILLLSLTGCEGAITPKTKTNSSSNTNTKSNTRTKKSKAKCDISECLEKLDQHSSLEQINEVIGFEGTEGTSTEDYTKYSWELSDDAKIVATMYSSSTSLSLDVKDDLIKNSKVNFSKYDEVKKAIQGGQNITYDEVKSKFGADGVLVEISSTSKKYRWVSSNGSYMNASFSNSSGKCTTIMGRVK